MKLEFKSDLVGGSVCSYIAKKHFGRKWSKDLSHPTKRIKSCANKKEDAISTSSKLYCHYKCIIATFLLLSIGHNVQFQFDAGPLVFPSPSGHQHSSGRRLSGHFDPHWLCRRSGVLWRTFTDITNNSVLRHFNRDLFITTVAQSNVLHCLRKWQAVGRGLDQHYRPTGYTPQQMWDNNSQWAVCCTFASGNQTKNRMEEKGDRLK